MLLEDSLEFNPTIFPTNGSELLQMKQWDDICFSDIWIPSKFLPNRLLPFKPEQDNTPVIYRTLKKRAPVDKCFSAYDEDIIVDISNRSSAEKLLDSLEEIPSEFNQCESWRTSVKSSYEREITSSSDSIVDLLQHLHVSESENEGTFDATINKKLPPNFNTEVSDPEPVVNFPFIYQRPKDESSIVPDVKFKSNKKRKSKKKNQKNIPLDNFFLSKEESSLISPEKDEFYESIMKQKYGNEYVFKQPTLQETYSTSSSDSSSSRCQSYSCTGNQNSGKKTSKFLSASENLTSSVNATNDVLGSSEVELIIENLPLSVTKETLVNIVKDYGEIKGITIWKKNNTLKAILLMNIDEPEWIIDVLNDSQPFGVSSGKPLKCYLKE